MPADQPSLEARAAAIDTLFQRDCAALDRDAPWLATFDLELGDRRVTYRLASKRVPDVAERDARIIGFAHPLAAAYYEHRPGDAFELDRPGFAHIAATIAERCTATPAGRRLAALDIARIGEQGRLVRASEGFARLGEDESQAPPRSVAGLPDIRALLTPDQYRLITSARDRPLIIQGRAGSGKTTVALYRVAYLCAPEALADAAPIDPSRVLIVMFNRALQRFVERSLADVELGAATIDTFHGWAYARIKRAYKGELEILAQPSEDKHEQTRVSAIKKQLGLLRAIDEFVAEQERRMVAWLGKALEPYKALDWLEDYEAGEGPIVRRLMALRSKALVARDNAKGKQALRLTEIHKILRTAVEKMIQYKDELLRLYTDTALLKKHLPEVPPWDLELIADYQKRLQRKDASERRAGRFVHFDDLAPLIKLIVIKHGGLPDALRDDSVDVYDHLMIDEAQDFGAVELDVLLSVVRARSGVTVVGDINQKIVPSAEFIGWDALARELGLDANLGQATVAKLEVAHRSTGPIMAVANSLTGDAQTHGRPGSTPRFLRLDGPEAAYASLVTEVARLAAEHEHGHIAVVTRHREDAKTLAGQLAGDLSGHLGGRGVTVRRGYNVEFAFEPGVTVTNMAQIKGLEFDAVVVVDPSEVNYPVVGQDGRRWLYTLLTRAKAELLLIGHEAPTGLLSKAIAGGLIEVDDATVVPTFADVDDDEPF
jgi:DNA helicase II / ATP-dependent DNA helicase PcrA